ncbi:11880_t:CDS:2, partial [Funneliformis geosporum]
MSAEVVDPAPKRHHKRTFTGYAKHIIKKEQAKWSKETLALWEKYGVGESDDKEAIQKSFIRHVTTTLARSMFNIDNFSAYQATAHTVRDRLIQRWNDTQQTYTEVDPKRVYYLSLEFLLGRSLDNALLNLGLKESCG